MSITYNLFQMINPRKLKLYELQTSENGKLEFVTEDIICMVSKLSEYVDDKDKIQKTVPFTWIREVTLLEDSIIHQNPTVRDVFETNKWMLHAARKIWENEDLCELAIKNFPDSFVHVINQTEKLCDLAVRLNPHLLQFVKNQTFKQCETAVKTDLDCINYVNDEDHVFNIVKNIPCALTLLTNKSEKYIRKIIDREHSLVTHLNQKYHTCEIFDGYKDALLSAIFTVDGFTDYVNEETAKKYMKKYLEMTKKNIETKSLLSVSTSNDTTVRQLYTTVSRQVSNLVIDETNFKSNIISFEILHDLLNGTPSYDYDFKHKIEIVEEKLQLTLTLERDPPMMPIVEKHIFQ